MGQQDLPQGLDRISLATNEYPQSKPAEEGVDKFRAERFQVPVSSSEKKDKADSKSETKGTAITNQGQIKEMSLPLGWKEATVAQGSDILRSERIFRPKYSESSEEKRAKGAGDEYDENGVKVQNRAKDMTSSQIVFFYSGRPNSEADGNAFRNILAEPAHKLSAEELKSLEKTLGDLADKESFKLSEAQSRDVNGKRVLDVKGTWLFNNNQYHGLLFNGDGSGQVVQQIYLMAPESVYRTLNNDLELAAGTIKWR